VAERLDGGLEPANAGASSLSNQPETITDVSTGSSSNHGWSNFHPTQRNRFSGFKQPDFSFPVFEWDADDDDDNPDRVAFNHGTVRPAIGEGLVVDTGAVEPLSGLDFILRQSAESRKHGLETQWYVLDKPKNLSGIGGGANTCTHKAKVYCALDTGELVSYTTPVIPKDLPSGTSPVPALYALDDMAAENTYFGTRNGLMALVPDGTSIQWPSGTRFRQCEKAPSGHWLLKVSSWDKVKSKL
jgi:hypothetical protein